MIYFNVCTDSLSAANLFSKFNFTYEIGDDEYVVKVNLSDLDNFHAFIGYLQSNGKSQILQLLEDWCQDFRSEGEEIPDGFEDEILEIITS
jgi:hypothetical protein